MRQKLFSPTQKGISKEETNRKLSQDTNNNIIPTDVNPTQPVISLGLKPNKTLFTQDKKTNQPVNSPDIKSKSDNKTEKLADFKPTYSVNRIKVTEGNKKEDKSEESEKSTLKDDINNNNISDKVKTKEVGHQNTEELNETRKEGTKENNMSATVRTSSRFAKNTDTNNNEEGVNGYSPADRQVSAADRAARRAKRAQRANLQNDTQTDSPKSVEDKVSEVTLNDNKPEAKPGSVGGLRGRTATWSPQKSTPSAAPKYGSAVCLC